MSSSTPAHSIVVAGNRQSFAARNESMIKHLVALGGSDVTVDINTFIKIFNNGVLLEAHMTLPSAADILSYFSANITPLKVNDVIKIEAHNILNPGPTIIAGTGGSGAAVVVDTSFVLCAIHFTNVTEGAEAYYISAVQAP